MVCELSKGSLNIQFHKRKPPLPFRIEAVLRNVQPELPHT